MTEKLKAFKLIVIVLIAGAILFRQNLADYVTLLGWAFTFTVLGLIFLPLADLVFVRFRCRGYMFARVLALAMAGWLSFMLSAMHILPFRTLSCYLTVAVFLIVNLLINRKTNTFRRYATDNDLFRSSANKEALFLALLIFWTYLRALRPDIEGLEKFMEFGFINSILRNDWMPAPDMWLAGETINYYYLGHFLSAYMTRLTGIHPAVTYNLMMASLFAISFMLAYSIGSFLVQFYVENANDGKTKEKGKITERAQRRAEKFAGLLAGAVVTLAGNLHSMIFGILFPQWNDHEFYWFPSATRYIGFNPPVQGDGTIHEFPLYSYVVSDLHAHVINMIFVLTAIATICAVAVHFLEIRQGDGSHGSPRGSLRRAMRTVPLSYFVLMLLIGLFTGMNFWDFPIYVVVTGAVLLYVNLKKYDFSSNSVNMTIYQTVAVAVAAYILLLPFHLTFESMGTAISVTSNRSMIRQLLVLWGYQLYFGVALTVVMTARYFRLAGKKPRQKNKPDEDAPGATRNALFRYINTANPADAIVFILFICATGLFIIPELIYVVDIYGGQPRANTMFKLGYQAFIMFGLGCGYTMVRLFLEDIWKFKAKTALITLGVILLGSAFVYPFYAIPGWYRNRDYQGLDGTTYMINEKRDYKGGEGESYRVNMSDDHALVQFINENIQGSPVLVEAIAPGNDSYTINGRISANTGLPNVINWYWHEYLWRNSNDKEVNRLRTEMLDMRRDDTNSIYTLRDPAAVRALLDKYDVTYLVVGEIERLRYPEMNEQVLLSMGEVVFRSGDLVMIEVG